MSEHEQRIHWVVNGASEANACDAVGRRQAGPRPQDPPRPAPGRLLRRRPT